MRQQPQAQGGMGNNPFETPRMTVTITGVEIESSQIMVRDSFGNEFLISGALRPKGTGMPVSGERWILAKIGGTWVLELQIGAALPPIIEGDRAGVEPIVQQMLDAMAIHGLVVDLTIREPDEPPLDDTTDPSIPEPGDEDWEEDDYGEYESPSEPPPSPIEPVPPGTTPDDYKVPGSKVSSDLLTVVTYNQIYKMGPQRAKQDLKRLYKQSDLIGLQECSPASRAQALADRPSNWGMYRPSSGGFCNPILWDKDVLKKMDEGTQTFSVFDGPGTKRPARAANWVKFQHIKTGAVFVFVCTHLENAAAVPGYYVPGWRPDSPRHVERFKEQMAGLVPMLVELQKHGEVLLVGDLNVRSPGDLKHRNPGFPTAEFGRLGMRSNWDILGQPAFGTSGGGNTIDQKYLTKKVPGQMKFIQSRVLRGYNSDHKPVITKIRIKNFA